MPDTRRNIAEFGDGDHWYYDCWRGFSPNFIDEWFQAEGTGPGEAGISGPPRGTLDDALADIETLRSQEAAAGRPARDSWRVIKCEPALRISIAHELAQTVDTSPN